MKRVLTQVNFLVIILMSIGSLSCFDDRTAKDNTIKDSKLSNTDSALTEVDSTIKLWVYDPQADSMTKKFIPENLTVEMALDVINTKYCEGICVDYVNRSADTVFVKIDDASQLTQRMGTTGARRYMSELVYALTEVPSINFVDIDFEEGDHAMPGVYKRSDF